MFIIYNKIINKIGLVIILNEALLLMGCVILICILVNNFLEKLPIPSLLIFIGLGIVFGENGLVRIHFDNYSAVNAICAICLIFIMFYGGFGTNINAAKPVLLPSALMATLGVIGTAGAVAVFTHFVFSMQWTESLLVGSVISSTDAASVFNILRSKKLALKYHTDSLLEVESGSNDPMSYMLTSVAIALLSSQSISLPILLAQQIIIGSISGIVIGILAVKLLHQQLLPSQQSHTIFLVAIMILSYALPTYINGNGYLSVYLCGIWIGNSNLPQKKYLIHFFDVLTHVSQVQIFFLLGLLLKPVSLPSVMLPALIITIFLAFIARPLVSTIILAPFKPKLNQVLLISWSGLRGAASIVFAIGAVLANINIKYNLFNLVFCMVLLSIAIQGTLLPFVAKKLSMIDKEADIGRTFNDYQEDNDISFIKLKIKKNHNWCGQTLAQIKLPSDLLVAMIMRNDEIIVPTGQTKLQIDDLAVLAARSFEDRESAALHEVVVENKKQYVNKTLSEISQTNNNRVILIKRGINTIIPSGNTTVKHGDILVMTKLISSKKER